MNEPGAKLWKRIVTITVLMVLGFFLVRASATMAARYFDAREVQDMYTSELENLTEQEEYLENQLDSLVTEEGLDFFVRDHYRVTKPGERLIIIVDEEPGE